MGLLKPLNSTTGQSAEGSDQYFPRPHITKKIRRMLDSGEHILVSAPRRIGKTTLLKHIQKNPAKDQIIKYLIISSVNSNDEFFQKLYKKLIRDNEIYDGIDGYLKQATHAVKQCFSRLRGVSLEGGVEIDSRDCLDYYHECYELIRNFNAKKIIIIVDEFPDALNNIRKKDRDAAIRFLQQHRDLRQQFSGNNLQFIYTGSTGLRNVVKKIGESHLINDLHEITVKPLSYNEAQQLIQRLILGYQQHYPEFKLNDSQLEMILQKITWRLPFYLQAIVHSLFDRYEDNETNISDADIDAVFLAMTKANSSYSSYFENWIYRLKTAFSDQDFALAMAMLKHSAVNNALPKSVLTTLTQQYGVTDYKYILHTLEYDGYLNEAYAFNSNLLQQWWLENVVD